MNPTTTYQTVACDVVPPKRIIGSFAAGEGPRLPRLGKRIAIAFLCALSASGAEMPPVTVDVQAIDDPVEPVPIIQPYSYEAKDGLLLRNGKPFYWISDATLGGIHATPLGLWLARLHGSTMASVPHSSCIVKGAEKKDGIHIQPTIDESAFSWIRETIRLGFLTQAPEGFFRPEMVVTLSPILAKYPALRQSIYDHGHHMGADPGDPLGLDVLDAKRYPMFAYGGKTGFFLPELNRESGPDPYNERVKVGFRDWAKAKYGSLDEANAVWKSTFASWDDVILPHTTGEGVPDTSCYTSTVYGANGPPVMRVRNQRARMRVIERRNTPELYWDWMLYVQEDTTAFTRREFERARKQAPDALIGIDVRGHQSERDNYVSHDPIVIDAMADVFYVHSSGFRCYDYGGRPFEPRTLHDAICWPLFTCRYFRCNTTKPILNSEDIVRNVIAAAPSEEAMEANDLARFRERAFTARRRPDGGGTLTCTFDVPASREADRADGSMRFYLAGFAPSGFGATLNGKDLGYFGRAGSLFSFDITDTLEFVGENKLVLRYDGLNRIPENDDPNCHVLTQETLGKTGIHGERHYKSQFWSYLMGGHCADIVWHWNYQERLRLYQAALAKRLAVAAETVLPAVRFKKEKVAFLYSYMAGIGLPASSENRHHELMDWSGALEFTGHRFDILGEERFRERAADYPIIVAPDIWCVADETVEAAKAYVRAGGTLVATPGSLGKTFTRYRDSGFAAFAAGDTGKGRVVVLEMGLGMATLAERLAPLLPAPELAVDIAPSGEFPCVERLLAGDARRKVLYLQNWGGLDQTCRVALPEDCRDWTATPLEGSVTRTADGLETTVEGSQGVAVCLLTAPGESVPDLELPDETKAVIDRVRDLMTFGRPAPGRKRVLFAIDGPTPGSTAMFTNQRPYSGAEIFPHEIEAVRALGAEADALHPSLWTPELLANYAAVVVSEGFSLEHWMPRFKKPEFREMLKSYVENGGAIFAEVYSGKTPCAKSTFFLLGKEAWDMDLANVGIARDETSHGFGDPRQILTDNLSEHPVADGVGSVQLFALTPMKIRAGSGAEAVVSLPETSTNPGAPVVAAVESGKGRVVASTDPMAFQPYRIGEAGNARLLLNIFAWLLHEPADPALASRLGSFEVENP